MALGAAVEAPWGYVSLCVRSPVDCVYDDSPQARVGAVVEARALARARWEAAMRRAAERGVLAGPAVAASVGKAGGVEAAAPPPAPTGAGPWRITLKPAWRLLERVNTHVNRAIRPATDLQVHGVRDWWTAPLSSGGRPLGDCKDYALEKRRELIAAGLPARALSLALARTAAGEPHAVLVVAAREGDYVLDNLAPKIRLWSRTPYSWQARQSPADPLVWLSVLPEPAG